MSCRLTLVVVAICVGMAAASHRLKQSEIDAIYESCKNPDGCNPHTPEAVRQRAEIKQLFTEQLMQNGKKRSDAESGAEEWLETIQEAKRAVHRSMGIGNVEPRDNGLWQGDILLTKEQAEEKIAEYSGYNKRSIMTSTTRKWPTTIPYYIDPAVTATSKAAILKGLQQIQTQLTCIKFQQLTTKPTTNTFMSFKMAGSGQGCQGYAFIGKVSSQENVVAVNVDANFCYSYNGGCAANSIVVHEVFHSLGYSHEQCRYDRDNYVKINFTNIASNDANNFAKDTTTDYNAWGQTYNFASVMHYQYNVLGINSAYDTITPLTNVAANKALMGNSCAAQAADIVLGMKFYCASG